MALKLKLKIAGGSNATPPAVPSNDAGSGLPKIKIKPPKPQISKPTDKHKDKKVKLKLTNKKSRSTDSAFKPALPRVRVKPTRVPGEGYDSEAPELEDDPLLEQGIVLRFLEDTNLDFVHNAVDSGDFAGLNIKWVTRDKAVVNVNGTLYSARLIDLPTVTEIFKTTDKKNIFKTFDLCQMLLILRKINPSEFNLEKDFEIDQEQYYHHPLFKYSNNKELKEKTYVYKDGLTNPFQDVFRRFRPRKVNNRIMDLVDAKVNQLIKADDDAEEFTFDIVDLNKQPPKFSNSANTPNTIHTPIPHTPHTPHTPNTPTTPMIHDDDPHIDDMDIDLEDELNKALDGDELGGDMNILGNMMAEAEEQAEEAKNDNEDEEEDDDDDDDDDEDDEQEEDEQRNHHGDDSQVKTKQHITLLQEEIAELETACEHNKKNLTTATSRMMRLKFQTAYNNLRASLDAKKNSLAKLTEEHGQSQRSTDVADSREEEYDEEEEPNDDDAQGDDLDELFL